MTVSLTDLCAILPALCLLGTILAVLCVDLFCKQTWLFPVTSLGLGCVMLSAILLTGQSPYLLTASALKIDDLSLMTTLFMILTVWLALAYAHRYLRVREVALGDFYVLTLCATLGMLGLVMAHHLVTFYLSLELLSLPLYTLSAMRSLPHQGPEAALKYFVMGSIASGFLLYGLSFVYGVTGELAFDAITTHVTADQTLLRFALVFIIAGMGFKMATIPFHQWAPDVYEGAPVPAASLISSAPKIAVMVVLIRLLKEVFPVLIQEWQALLLALALLSIAIGNLCAMVQSNLKRLFAYSAIAHMGYAILGLIPGTDSGYAASLYYVVVYAMMALAGFAFLLLLSRGAAIEYEMIDDLKGLNRRNPWLAFLMMVVLFSMAGVPPAVGFFTKLFVLKALVDVHMTWVAAVALVFAVLGAFYYIRVIKVMYFDEPRLVAPVRLPIGLSVILSCHSLMFLYLGLFPSALWTACMNALHG